MSEVKVSIVCTNFNKGSWIGEAIEGFLAQKTKFDFEVIIIDDKSTDDSPKIIKKYASEYPDKIKVIFNRKNLGITRTWKKVCKYAKGKYIARCDGDDYWIDEYKLQKQVDALEKSKKSKWCSTDYDVVNENGVLVQKSSIESGYISRPKSYAEMLATKGFTMSSTWLVDTKLMLMVNNALADSAVDDTFNIQLDLFNKTELTYIPDSTTVYRVNQGSDSKPIDNQAAKERDMRLMATQLQYVKKYKDRDYFEIIKILLQNEVVNSDRLRLINSQRKLIQSQEKIIQDQDSEIQRLNGEVQAILSSKKYRTGKYILMPISGIRTLLKGRKK